MNTIFLVSRRVGDGDAEMEPILVTPNSDLADAFIKEEQTKDDALADIIVKMNVFLRQWCDDNPLPWRDNGSMSIWLNKLLKAKQEFLISIGQSPNLIQAIDAYPGKAVYYKQTLEYRE